MKLCKRVAAALLAALLLTALPIPARALSPVEAKDAALDYIARAVPSPGFGEEWFVLALARGGVRNAPYYQNYYARVEAYVKAKGAALSATRSTENSRLILALSAIGKDAAGVGGYDLTAPLADLEWLEAQGVNGPVSALLALDAGGYGTAALRETLLDYILGKEMPGGGWSFTGAFADADTTAMALQALVAYRADPVVEAAIGRALPALSTMQLANGSFGHAEEGANVESTAQVVIALAALGIDPQTDARFVKAGDNALGAVLAYQMAGGGFKHKLADARADGMATEQAARALVAYGRFVNGRDSLYASMYEPHAHVLGEWLTRIAATCTAPGLEYRDCGKCLVEEETRQINALGHVYTATVTQPTKKAGGYTTHTCARCGHSYTDNPTAKIKRTEGFTVWDWIMFIVLFGWLWME